MTARAGGRRSKKIPVLGVHTTPVQDLKMGAVVAVVTIARSCVLRRLFDGSR